MTRQEGSQTTLQAPERANLFVISLDDERRWYRYHHLFAEILCSRLQQTQPTLLSELHRRASEWYEQQGLIVDAVQHALAAHDVKHTADLLEQWGIGMFHHGQFHLVLGWLNALPQALVDARPHLCLLQAHLLLFLQEWEKARTYLDQIAESLQDDCTSREAQAIQGKVAVLRGGIALSTGNLADCVVLAHEALALLPQTEETWHLSAIVRTGLFYLVDGNVSSDAQHQIERLVASLPTSSVFPLTGNILLLARLYMMQGKLHQALATVEQAVQKNPEQAYLWRWIGGPAYIGKLLREWNDLEAAERHLREVLDHLLWADIITEGYITLARIQWARGKYQQAQVTLESFEQLAHQHQFAPHLFTRGAAIRAEIALVQGDLAAAVSWANDCTLSAHDELSYLREQEYLTLVRVRIAQGRSDPQGSFLQDALHLSDRLLQDARAKARMYSAVEILVLKALALYTCGDLPAALDMLQQALTLAQPEGYVRIFLDESAPMLRLLSQVGKVDPSLQGYVQMLLVHAKVIPAPPTPFPLDTERSRQQPLVDSLSQRELEVLRLLSTGGASNERIAEHLVIALGTVKRHISNILAKLGVSNRTQAVAQARAFDLL